MGSKIEKKNTQRQIQSQQSQLFQQHIVPACTVSLPMKQNAIPSGTAGMVKLAVTNARQVWHTIVKHVSACGPIKFQNVKMKVCTSNKCSKPKILKPMLIHLTDFVSLIVCFAEVANGFGCPAPGEVTNAGTFSRHAHPDDCRKYYICLEGVAREYGCPIGTVFKIGDSDGTGNCEDPEDVPGWWVTLKKKTQIAHWIVFTNCILICLIFAIFLTLGGTYSEDYYGDLDLKSIRKSELLAGISGGTHKQVQPKARNPVADKA